MCILGYMSKTEQKLKTAWRKSISKLNINDKLMEEFIKDKYEKTIKRFHNMMDRESKNDITLGQIMNFQFQRDAKIHGNRAQKRAVIKKEKQDVLFKKGGKK